MALFGASSLGSYFYRSASIDRLESSLHRDVVVLAKIPELRDAVRRLNVTTRRISQNGGAESSANRSRTIDRIRQLLADIRQIDAADGPQVAGLSSAVGRLIQEEDAVIARKGRAPDTRALASARSASDDVRELASRVGESAVVELERRVDAEERSYHRGFVVRVLIELLGAGGVGFYLYFFVLRPIQSAETVAASWELGKRWPAASMPSIPEMRALLEQFSRMAERLNGQFEKEKEFGEFKTKLVSIAGHEFSNSLTVILNAAFLLEERATVEEKKRDESLYRMINQQSRMLVSVADNFLNMGRLEAGKLAMSLTDTDLSAAVKDTGERLTPLAAAKNIELRILLPDEAARVPADSAALNMVLNNLTTNAIKYTPDGGTVTLGVRRAAEGDGAFVVSVSDTGIGIAPDDQRRILSGYYRTESGKQTSAKGFGIGLALARQIVEAHGSVLELESAAGKGAKFFFALGGEGRVAPT